MKCIFSFNLFFTTLYLLIYVKHASSIFCYDCNSAFDPRCGEEFDPFSLGVVNCSLKDPLEHIPSVESSFCRIIKMEIYGKVRIVRQCGFLSDEADPKRVEQSQCRRQTGVGDLFVTYCTCDTNLCNAAYSSSSVFSVPLLLGLVLYVVY